MASSVETAPRSSSGVENRDTSSISLPSSLHGRRNFRSSSLSQGCGTRSHNVYADDQFHRRTSADGESQISEAPDTHEFYDTLTEPESKRDVDHKRTFPMDICCCGCLQTGNQMRYHLRIAGPSMSGKTALVRYLKHGQFTPTQPTKEIEVSRIVWQDCPFIMWDSRKHNEAEMKPALPMTANIANDLKKRSLVVAHHSMDAIIYVVDASDPGRLKIAGRDFERLLRRYHNVPVVLVVGAKGDKAGSVNHSQIRMQLRLLETTYDRECAVCLVSNVTGEGIYEAMDWVYNKIRQREGFWTSFSRRFCVKRDNDLHFRFPVLGFTHWDPFSCCRYSRLSS